MHVVILSDWEVQGGAAIAASRLADALCREGHQVTRLVNGADGQDHAWVTRPLNSANTDPPFLPYRMARRLLPYRLQTVWDSRSSQRRLYQALDQYLTVLRPDVINVHNLHGAVRVGWSPDLLRICGGHAPTVWTLHDMWSFTGRCAYSYDCRSFLAGCDASCPTPTEYPALSPDRIAGSWEQRRRLFAEHPRLVAVTPSRWLAQEARTGLWARHRVEVIPNGLPLDIYRPVDRALAREALGLDPHGPILLVAAHNLTERRKGLGFLTEALHRLRRRPVTLATLGSSRAPLEAEGVNVYPLGHINHERTKVLVYSAADLFVHPAPVDNLPNVVVEAIACGTPIVSFAIGGLPEMVRPGKTGWLAVEVSSGALARAIDTAIGELEAGDWRTVCRIVAEADYSVEQQAKRYIDLFESLQDAASPSEGTASRALGKGRWVSMRRQAASCLQKGQSQ